MCSNDQNPDAKNLSLEAHPKFFVHVFLVDFLGALVPGILFTIAVLIGLSPIIHAVISVLSEPHELPIFSDSISKLLASTKDTPGAIWIAVFLFGILLSYTLGHLFYRRSPKSPDIKSFRLLSRRLLKNTDLNEKFPGTDADFLKKHNCTKEQFLLRGNFACDKAEHCEFPYPYLDKYLGARGHHHLVNLVPWGNDQDSAESRDTRSKTFINRLKIRLEVNYPENCLLIIRNEAHVRLASSMWHVGRVLWKSCLGASVGFILIMLALYYVDLLPVKANAPAACFSWVLATIVPALVVTIFAFYCQKAIERFLLYQRLREAFYVLEVAYTCFRDDPEKLKSPLI